MLNNAHSSSPKNWLNAPLAIVGMACRLPGADGLEAFWQLLHQGGYPIEPMSESKLDRERYFHPEKGRRGKTYADIGGFVSERELDWSLLNLTPEEAQQWDECHLNFCEVAARACQHAGYDPRNLSNRKVGVYVGHSGGSTVGGELAYRTLVEDYLKLLDDLPEWQAEGDQDAKQRLKQLLTVDRPQRAAGRPWVEAGFSASLVSQTLGLTGPHMAIDAACASSLVALAMGAMSIHSGQTDLAIIGGASFNKTDSLILFSHAQSCSSSMSRPFDERADGLISSEGYVALVVKSLARAQADGDHIQAILHGIGISTDGRGKSLWAPRKEGQYAAIERAYSAEVAPASVQMVEAHATSTHLGDATEMEALATFYGKHLPAGTRLPVGSVKSNIGHTLETAGLAGVVKTVLAMQQGVIPPSLNVDRLNQSIPWQDIPLSVVRAPEDWPSLPTGQPRRAAVNAFGIGGLNVHVVVEQAIDVSLVPTMSVANPSSQSRQTSDKTNEFQSRATSATTVMFEPIAIIGRGLVLPGALDVGSYETWLARSQSRIDDKPTNSVSVAKPTPLVASIDDFQYDWRRHKVPPKQIAQANPLQFMLLEAAEQALREADLLDREFDRRHTAVVVGSVFGGDFGNALFGGLRLPELREHLLQTLAEQGCDAQRAQSLADAYETHFFKRYPALLDETGSFTSSTLASRLSKTYNLMGGAMAIDAGDTSSFAALNAACQLLHSGSVNMVLCAAAQLACDRAALENLAQSGRLQRRGPAGENYTVGQGVALVLLKTLSAARHDGDQILGVIDALGVGFDATSLQASVAMAARQVASVARISKQQSHEIIGEVGLPELDRQVCAATGMSLKPSRNLPLTGFMYAAQGLVDLIGVTLAGSGSRVDFRPSDDSISVPLDWPTGPQLIASHTQSGQSYVVSAAAATALDNSLNVPEEAAETLGEFRYNQSSRRGASSYISSRRGASSHITPRRGASSHIEGAVDTHAAPHIYRLSAATVDELKQQLTLLAASPAEQASRCAADFSSLGEWRAAIVCAPDALAAQARKLSLLVGNSQSSATALEQGLLWSAPHELSTRPVRVAWLFPGQGSQYSGMLSELCQVDMAAAKALKAANAALVEMGQPSFGELAWDSPNQLGENVWHTQAAMLVADWIMLCTLRSRGFTADLISGHSFGEFPAMLAAECWDLSAALRATYERCRAIVEHVPPGCAMLSVHADAATVANTIACSRLPISISHRNAPQQTVVGGKQSHIAQLAQLLDNEGLNSRLLPVPTAFHTSALQTAVQPFRAELESIELHPPRTPLLSSVDNRFIAEPKDIRDGLAQQLTAPLDFVALTERLVREGVTLAVEVGPQQVLSRLVRQTTDKLSIVPTDHANLGAPYQLQIVAAMCELHGIMPSQTASSVNTSSGAMGAQLRLDREPAADEVIAQFDALTTRSVEPHCSAAVIHFDATAARRKRLRNAGQAPNNAATQRLGQSGAVVPQHFDATQTRRQQRRHAAAPSIWLDCPRCESNESSMWLDAPRRESSLPRPSEQHDAPTESVPSSANSASSIETFLIDFVVEQTGYPAEIIELDWDIEADLGIDSIKKAQLFGELREFFDLESHAPIKLDDYRSLRDIAGLLHNTPGKADWLHHGREASGGSLPASDTRSGAAPLATPASRETPSTTNKAPAIQPSMIQSSTIQSVSRVEQAAAPYSTSQLSAFLVDFVVEQTGYPPEIVELDADLEADLGIDSIKKAQLFGELREMFAIDPAAFAAGRPRRAGESSRGGMDEIRTLRQILDALVAQQSTSSNANVGDGSHGLKIGTGGTDGGASGHINTADASHALTAGTGGVGGGASSHIKKDRVAVAVAEGAASEIQSQLVESSEQGGQIPSWESGKRDAASRHAFTTGLRANLRALVARRNAAPLATLPSNGYCTEYQTRIQQFSEMAAADHLSLQALERALVGQTRWQPSRSHSTWTDVVWLADWLAPKWLATHGAALGLKVNQLGQVELDALGSVSPLAVLTGPRLCVAGINDSCDGKADGDQACPIESVRKLSDLLLALRGHDVDELTSQARRWSLACDWWLMIVDANKRTLTSVESCGGAIALKTASLAELSFKAGGQPSTTVTANSAVARLGFDPARGRFVVECAVRPQPYPRVVQELPEILQSELPQRDQLHAAPTTRIANRYVLRMVPAPHRAARGRQPKWAGTAVVVGDNPVAIELELRLRDAGVDVVRWSASDDPRELARKFGELTATCHAPHLFLTTPCDEQARFSLDEFEWKTRRNRGILGNFWLCQAWLEHISQQGIHDDASLLLVSTLGGSFGFDGVVTSTEGGGLGGMLKSILIESWMQGYRSLPIKTIDTSPDQSPLEIVDALWQELAIPSYDNEIAIIAGQRHVVRAVQQPLTAAPAPSQLPSSQHSLRNITRGGNWICTGGARGITAFVAEKLAQRYGLTLHLLGTAPQPTLDPTWQFLDNAGLKQLKVRIMTEARAGGRNPVKAWQDTEKSLEIDARLRRLASLGIEAHYYCCDVADRSAVADVLTRVRQLSGPIHGVLHGAGVGKDSRFNRKQADKVDQCIAAKVDGALSLMAATELDPLECFIGFGSISGRFGANGHTDYSLANDMLCKTIDAFHGLRPNCRAIGFHWHAWGDIGMATKPETKLALEMIDMQFMPAEEGLTHLVNELEGRTGEREVLITDDRYYRMFYPAETLSDNRSTEDADGQIPTPLLSASMGPGAPIEHRGPNGSTSRSVNEVFPSGKREADAMLSAVGERTWTATVRPSKDPFLTEHKLDGRPLLPFVIATEMLLEAGQRNLGTSSVMLHNVTALSALRFFGDSVQDLRVESRVGNSGAVECRLLSDFVARDGRLVEANRVNFTAQVVPLESQSKQTRPTAGRWATLADNGQRHLTQVELLPGTKLQPVVYPEIGAKFYVGWPLQRLKKVALVEGGIVGYISAPALIELAGVGRDVSGWRIPSAALDACLFAVGILAWQQVAPGSALPVRMGQIELGRLPSPGEACEVHARLRSSDAGTATFDFTLIGVDGEMLVDVVDYQVAWSTNPYI